ncbi:hypothetical protein [Streptomyces sp. CAU 1734]|uniref:hypothetical protein n=1 Tax=Streptomyces sp. CAU 1734 TaxID=3140360 RepID=UPI0032611BF2
MTTLLDTATRALLNPLARLLITLTDHVTRRCDVPNPVAAVRVTLVHIADQNLSGADAYMEITSWFAHLGFTWPAGWCNSCNTALTDDEDEADGLCGACAPDHDPH